MSFKEERNGIIILQSYLFPILTLILGLSIMVANKELIEETEEYAYGFTSFLAEFGGALGLFVGFSFFSLWEYFEPLFMKLRKQMKNT